jgi:hypothetical protein
MQKPRFGVCLAMLLLLLHGVSAGADDPPAQPPEHHHPMAGMAMPEPPPAPTPDLPGSEMQMPGMLGPYDMSREASGTSWQPDSTPVPGLQHMGSPWSTMWDGFANLIYDHQGGPRGADKGFSTSMLMGMGRRELEQGALGVRVMVSADPLMGRDGYPELFQTGETADGVHPLIDRQHPHNLLMEAAASYSRNLSGQTALFAYAGIAGEPALGPPAFMHRLSGIDNPVAPLGHHWLDATHISYGVLTAGSTWDRLRLEASVFNGREPDQNRYQVELRHLDSNAVRVSWNPSADLALQASTGRLASPEQLAPDVTVRRSTVSASYNRIGRGLVSQTTMAWGRNQALPGSASNAWLLESEVSADARDTVFGRIERVGKDELFGPGQPLDGRLFTIESLSLGYIRDVARVASVRLGIGGMATVYRYDHALDASYGSNPVSCLLFLRARL